VVLNAFLGKTKVIDALMDNQKARALVNPVMRAAIGRLGASAIACLGYPVSALARIRTHDVLKMMSPVLAGSLVDVGCAFGGAQTFEFARRLAPNPVLGIDVDPVSIETARRLNEVLGFRNLSFRVGDVVETHSESRFDIVFTSETLEHIRDDRAAIASMRRLMSPTGWLVVSVPYAEHPVEHDAPQAAFKAHPRDSGLFPGGYHWRSGYNEASLRRLAEACGLEIVSVVRSKALLALPDSPVVFPVNYLASWLAGRLFGRTSHIAVLARRLD
jgi:2-polyprenyl-3-methyl-5-hydroxy-6-metoxy-1,4-benzoquinol methylase